MTETTDRIPDAQPSNWVDRFAPAALRPYARLARWDRPVGWVLLLIPCWVSAAFVAGALGQAWPDPWHLVLFLVGAIAMRGAGCTWNDIVDRDLDAAVARTRARPIPSGAVTVRQALVFLTLQALVGLAVLLQFNLFTIVLALASLGVVGLYPFLKRVTDWPQIGLGFAFSWGGLLGWSAETGSLTWAPVLLFLGFVAWTVGYDTVYALQDKEDDAVIGVRSTARLFGRSAIRGISWFYLATILLLVAAFVLGGVGIAGWVALVAAGQSLALQLRKLDIDDPASALAVFRSNRVFGAILFVGLTLDAFLTRAV